MVHSIKKANVIPKKCSVCGNKFYIRTGSKTITFHFYKCVDAGGHPYSTVRGKKLTSSGIHGKSTTSDTIVFMAENLNVGTQVTMGHNQLNNDTIEKYCYDDDSTNCNIYGGIYKWDEMMKYVTFNGSQGICPDNWHIPTYTEFMDYVTNYTGGGLTYGGSNMKEVGTYPQDPGAHWYNNADATDSLGFTALPSGCADFTLHSYIDLHWLTNWWTSTEYNTTNADYIQVQAPSLGYGNENKEWGWSVRCVHN